MPAFIGNPNAGGGGSVGTVVVGDGVVVVGVPGTVVLGPGAVVVVGPAAAGNAVTAIASAIVAVTAVRTRNRPRAPLPLRARTGTARYPPDRRTRKGARVNIRLFLGARRRDLWGVFDPVC
jgi:hypothetical protein